MTGQGNGLTPRDVKRTVAGLRFALGWVALGWGLLFVLHLGLRHWVLQSRPDYIFKLWGTTLPVFLTTTLEHLFHLRLVLLLLVAAWLGAFLWERKL